MLQALSNKRCPCDLPIDWLDAKSTVHMPLQLKPVASTGGAHHRESVRQPNAHPASQVMLQRQALHLNGPTNQRLPSRTEEIRNPTGRLDRTEFTKHRDAARQPGQYQSMQWNRKAKSSVNSPLPFMNDTALLSSVLASQPRPSDFAEPRPRSSTPRRALRRIGASTGPLTQRPPAGSSAKPISLRAAPGGSARVSAPRRRPRSQRRAAAPASSAAPARAASHRGVPQC